MPQHAVTTAGSQRIAKIWVAVWPAATAPQGFYGTLRANVCPPACVLASLEPVSMPPAVPSQRTATTGEDGSLWGEQNVE